MLVSVYVNVLFVKKTAPLTHFKFVRGVPQPRRLIPPCPLPILIIGYTHTLIKLVKTWVFGGV